jgi:hypothetical protein
MKKMHFWGKTGKITSNAAPLILNQFIDSYYADFVKVPGKQAVIFSFTTNLTNYTNKSDKITWKGQSNGGTALQG